MAVRRFRDLPKDLDKKISRDFNNLIKDVHFELSNRHEKRPTTMPVWTGFFASSWKVDTKAIPATEAIEDNGRSTR